MFLEVVNWMFNGFEGQLDLGQERLWSLQRCLLERLGLVIIAAAVFRPHVRISKRTLKEWKRGRRWRGLLNFHDETMWNGRLPASREVFGNCSSPGWTALRNNDFWFDVNLQGGLPCGDAGGLSHEESEDIWICDRLTKVSGVNATWSPRNHLQGNQKPEQLYRIFPRFFSCSSRLFCPKQPIG